MTTRLLQILAIVRIAVKRLAAQRWLALATAGGLLIAVALTMSIPMYADATHFRLLREKVTGGQPTGGQTPLAFLFHFEGTRRDGPQWQDAQALDQYLTGAGVEGLGLPRLSAVHLFRSDTFKFYPPVDPSKKETQYFLGWVSLATLGDIDRHVRLLAGNFPAPADPSANSVVEILVSQKFADESGLQPGDLDFLRRDDGVEIPVRVAGVWAPLNVQEQYWTAEYSKWALVPEATYAGRVSPLVEDELLAADWYVALDGNGLHAADVAPLLERIQALRQRAQVLLPGARLQASAIADLEKYQSDAPTLTLLLYAFSIPILGLVLAFVGLVAGLFVSQHQNELAVLRSRGATVLQVVGITAVEGLLLGAFALALGTPLGQAIAYAIGRARSFLNFTAPPGLRISPTLETLEFGAAAIALVLLLQIVAPTVGAARRTIVTYKQERARLVCPPWWQRAWLDVLLLIPAGYGVYLMQRQGGIVQAGNSTGADPFQNPLLLLVPALGIFAVTLFVLRIVPLVMALIAWLAAQTDSVGLLMAARYLSRTPAQYSAPLALLVLTLSLSAFTASLAQTLDRHLYRQLYYQIGTDLNITELGTSAATAGPGSSVPGQGGAGGGSTSYVFDPVDDHLRLPGVSAATRAGRYAASLLRVAGAPATGLFIGVDRLTFPRAAFWQPDFAPEPLGSLMNDLGAAEDRALVSREFLAQEALEIGDPLTIVVNTGEASVTLKLLVAGTFDLFPTWYPENGPLVVANLDYLYEQAGAEYPHAVWLRTRPDADAQAILAGVQGFTVLLDPNADHEHIVEDGLNTFVKGWNSAPLQMTAEQRRPERQGLFGLLSVGFATSALLTVLGFLLYAQFSFRRRFIELGMLRAIGLSAGQMTVLLACELAFLILTGIAAGTALGVWVSRWFIPYLQVGTAAAARFPPFIVEIAWTSIFQIYLVFGLLFLAALAALAALLLRMKIFQAVKLGETM